MAGSAHYISGSGLTEDPLGHAEREGLALTHIAVVRGQPLRDLLPPNRLSNGPLHVLRRLPVSSSCGMRHRLVGNTSLVQTVPCLFEDVFLVGHGEEKDESRPENVNEWDQVSVDASLDDTGLWGPIILSRAETRIREGDIFPPREARAFV